MQRTSGSTSGVPDPDETNSLSDLEIEAVK